MLKKSSSKKSKGEKQRAKIPNRKKMCSSKGAERRRNLSKGQVVIELKSLFVS